MPPFHGSPKSDFLLPKIEQLASQAPDNSFSVGLLNQHSGADLESMSF
jgi:hypothetical protein